ncbi:MAG: ribulose-phosphate 3-epimerase, partial [Firmicutes bacterium]|nr:ribulose-phosphate 3-epimerase [Bacillota bacterium]
KDAGADLVHCDIMDGVFVPNITFGPKMVKDIRKYTKLNLDVHLMIIDPTLYIDTFIEAGADMLSIHVESKGNTIENLKKIKERKCKAGIVYNPDTSLDGIEKYFDHIDFVLLMSVNPGFSGQGYIEKVTDKVKKLKQIIIKSGKKIEIEIDGGINEKTYKDAILAGVDIVIAGNYLFSGDMKEKIQKIKSFNQ